MPSPSWHSSLGRAGCRNRITEAPKDRWIAARLALWPSGAAAVPAARSADGMRTPAGLPSRAWDYAHGGDLGVAARRQRLFCHQGNRMEATKISKTGTSPFSCRCGSGIRRSTRPTCRVNSAWSRSTAFAPATRGPPVAISPRRARTPRAIGWEPSIPGSGRRHLLSPTIRGSRWCASGSGWLPPAASGGR